MTSGGPDTPQRNWNNIPDLLRTMPVKASVKDGKISNKTTMGKRLERFGEVRMHIDNSDYFAEMFILYKY